MMALEPWQWTLLVVGSLMVGMAKTGLAGLGTLFIALFATVLPTKQATGVVLPLLLFGDLVAVAAYRENTQWRHVWRLFPWAAAGVVAGYLAMDRIDNGQARTLVGGIILALVGLTVWRRFRGGRLEQEWKERGLPLPLVGGTGVAAGFTTLIANAAGPLMAIYLLALRLPKLEFLGTSAVFFMMINLFKMPFMMNLGLVNRESLAVNLVLAPAVWTGAFAGRWLIRKINQRWFEISTLGLTALGGLKLLLS
jgi:uncharacterized protein